MNSRGKSESVVKTFTTSMELSDISIVTSPLKYLRARHGPRLHARSCGGSGGQRQPTASRSANHRSVLGALRRGNGTQHVDGDDGAVLHQSRQLAGRQLAGQLGVSSQASTQLLQDACPD